ncbi:sensor domain-containing protein [Lysinibacillus sp. 54212]|uniref:sensor domain-containing protein n=1 Tax=Lysinibacillus sp. 54212 TaxID=3119829 RepID=UPI002FC9B4B6
MQTAGEIKTDKNNNQLQPHLTSLFEYNTDAICCLNLDGHIVDVNPAFMTLSGYSKEELLNRNNLEFIANDTSDFKPISFQHTNYLDSRYQLIRKDGSKIGCLMRLSPIKQEQQIIGYFFIVKNMTHLDKMAERYLESELNYRIIAENFQDVLILMDENREVLYISPSCKEIYGFDFSELNRSDDYYHIHPDYINEFNEKYEQVFANNEPFQIKLKTLHKERGFIWSEIKGKPVYDKEGNFLHMLLVSRDISKEQEHEENLMYFAYHDVLTGLPNRRLFQDYLKSAINLLEKDEQPFAFMLLDIDDFKNINDNYGHEIGDKVIIEFSRRLQKVVGDKGNVARLGGDEFVIIINKFQNVQSIEEIATKINELVSENVTIQHTRISITTSIGITICDKDSMNASTILKFADDALYRVKGQGKNEYSIY